MFLKGWNYLRGYVEIRVSGFSVERFMNLAVYRGVYLWDIRYTPKGVIMKVSVKGFKLLRPCAKKTKCRVKIISKNGYPFLAHRYRKRKIFGAGFIFFVAVLYVMSSFLWLVEIEGNERISSETLIQFCQDRGLKTGAYKKGFDKNLLENELMLSFSDLSWVNITVTGTRAHIQVTETIPHQELVNRDTPCDIIASKDGLITSIVTSAGTPLKKSKDVVQKGDVLVSGELVVKEDETGIIKQYVHSSAEVWAKMYNEISFTVPYTYTEKAYTGEAENYYTIQFFGKNFNLNFWKSGNSFSNYDKITYRNQLSFGENYPLPVILIKNQAREFIPIDKTRDREQAEELADRIVTSRILREFDFEADIVGKELEFIPEDDYLRVLAVITSLQRIDEERAIEAEK